MIRPCRPVAVALEGEGIALRPAALGEDGVDRGPVLLVEGKVEDA